MKRFWQLPRRSKHAAHRAWPTAALSLAPLVALLGPLAAHAAGPWPQTRQGWYVGFGLGGGGAALHADGTSTSREGAFSGNFRGGYVFNPELALGLESNAWTKEMDGATWTLSVGTAAVTYFPGAQGFYLRGGIGLGTAEVEQQFGNVSVTGSESGFGLTGGLGYEFRVLRTFALAPQVDYSWTTLDDFDFDYVMGALQFNWYFIPKP